MVMEERTVELNLINAQDLKKVTTFGSQTCYAVAYIEERSKRATGVDRSGGLNPTWNAKLNLTCDEKTVQRGGSYITIEIYSYGSFSNKVVGIVTVPLSDVTRQGKGSEPKSMAFEVRRPSGKVKGVLHLSVKLGEKRTVTVAETPKQQQQFPNAYGAYAGNYAQQSQGVYPPSTTSTQRASKASGVQVYPPPKTTASAAGGSSSSSSGASKTDEPVLAYPASGYGPQYPPQQYGYGQDYGNHGGHHQQYYPGAQDPYNYQQAYYAQPAKRRGSGAGMGLLGGVLGGLLLGDIIGGGF